jgi:hypothetical protein
MVDTTQTTGTKFAFLGGASVTNVPAGNIAATTVQTAIDELDAEKQKLITIKDEGSVVGIAGQYTSLNFVGTGITASQDGIITSQLNINVANAFTDAYQILTPSATNTIPNLTLLPLTPAKVKIFVNGLLESTGISVSALGVFTVNAGTLGYSIETTDVIQAVYLAV